ncbi:maleylpyruvate isomerase family mycothiol-dependent enzyme [Knoellia sp. CPCC 206435]|uniref:maleylpyruvate isomerase family mycothiol-dependent enzyme n=1 Tax=Knoellia terrae TaxID=3404797 RepID=UPI003B438865
MTDLLAAIDEHTTRLVSGARACDDLSAPSLCEGWTRDHVLNHLARNAEALVRLVGAAVDGTGRTMYDSPESRDAEIDAGVGRDPLTVVTDVEDTAAELAPHLRRLGPEHRDVVLERTPGGPTFRGGMLPFMRLREVVYHHVDLDVGFGFDDLDGDLQVMFLENELKRQRGAEPAPSLSISTDEGDGWSLGDGAARVTGSRAGVLTWLARQDPSGVRAEDLPELTRGL